MDRGLAPPVLFVAGCWYPVPHSPAQGIFVRRHAEAVARHHPVVVLHPTAHPDAPRRPSLEWRRHGPLHELYVHIRGRLGTAGLAAAGQLASLRAGLVGGRAIRERHGEPCIVHHHVVPSAGLTVALLRVFPTAPLVLTEHWSGYLPTIGLRLGLLRRLYTRWLTRRCRAVTTVSAYLRDAMLAYGFAADYRVVPNVVDTEQFRPADGAGHSPFRWVHVSCLRAEKRVPDIVRAVARLLGDGLDLELHIVGEGPQRGAVERLAADHQLLGSKVFLHGQQDGDGVAEHMRSCDAMVLFSDFENSPCVIGEALACAIPVVAPDTGGIPEHVHHRHGLLVPPGDLDALAEAMRSITTGAHRCSPAELRRYAERSFSPEVVGEHFAALYRRLLGTDAAGSTPSSANRRA